MKKIYSLLLLGGLLLLGVGNAWAGADWVGNSAIQVNGTWYYCGNSGMSWCSGGAFNGKTLGTISILSVGGQSQVHASGNENWGSGDLAMNYKFDGAGTEYSITISYNTYGGDYGNNMMYQSGGKGDFTTTEIDISGLAAGNHTIEFWFGPLDGQYDSNSNNNYKATFTIPSSVSKTITSAGWATYCSPFDLDFSGTITNLDDVYIVTGGADGVLAKTSVKGKKVPANTGLLLKGSAGTVTIPVVTSSNVDVSANKFIGVNVDTKIAANAGYVLMNDATNGLAFYKNSNAFTVGANTAYLPASFASSAPSIFRFVDEEENATDIHAIEANEKAVKFFENGKLLIMREGVVYDATGRAIR